MQQTIGMDKLKQKVKQYGDNITVLEEEIDIKLQMQYFKESKAVKRTLDQSKVLEEKDKLFDDGLSLEEKRMLLSKLASINQVEAFRTLEAYRKQPDKSLMEWSVLAYQESKMLLQSTLLDEPPLFISTGLGGKGTKLRYFVVFKVLTNKFFTDAQQQIITSELEYAFKHSNAELEDLRFFSYFATVTGLIPLEVGLKTFFSEIVKHCNELGNFVDPSLIITNARKLSFTEIEKAIDHQNRK